MKRMSDLRVIGVPWHVAHQYELAKLFKQYDLMLNHYRQWGERSRPMPENMKMVYEYHPGDYDLAILHVDQQCIDPANNKGKLFREMKELFKDIPVVIINHMTPFDDKLETHEVISGMKALVGNIPMVTNSKQAAAQWGWGHPIIHGMSPDEWLDLPKEPRAVTSLSPDGMRKAYRRELIDTTQHMLREEGLDLTWIQVDVKCKSFDDYRKYLGESLVYFHGAWQSPMPRARTEAMLSGCCIVTTRHHDIDGYITNGENGFIVPDNPASAAKLIKHLITDGYKEAVEIGQRGKRLAQLVFNHERWKQDWASFLQEVGVI